MALNSIIRKGCASIFPVAIRSVTSRRVFHSAISGVLNVKTSHDVQTQFLPFSRFSTTATSEIISPKADDDSLVRILETAIINSEQKRSDDIRVEFPFEIEDDLNRDGPISIKRKYRDEIITVIYKYYKHRNPEESNLRSTVIISQGDDDFVEFYVTVSPNEFVIDTMSVQGGDHDCYFDDLDENLQKAFDRYLEIRGIKPMANILLEYIGNKDKYVHTLFLKGMKDFLEK